ncbi:DUF624 domain-containing protein [Niallia circulans]|nr:DUF624 domain-containing protein [Niallia circulans]QKH63248.1 DUF624 domain-containing protein [Niallia circulans]
MYSITIKMAKNEDVSIVKAYAAAFHKNFKQSTIIWLILLAAGIILYMDYYYLNQYTGNLVFLVKISLGLFSFAYIILFSFIFPYVARFKDSVKDSIINTWKVALVHPFKTISVLMVTGTPIITLGISVYSFFFLLYFSLFIGFSLFAYITTYIILNIYEGIIPLFLRPCRYLSNAVKHVKNPRNISSFISCISISTVLTLFCKRFPLLVPDH